MASLWNPSWNQGFARSAAEAAEPGLWDGLVLRCAPSLGVTGNTIRDVSGHGNHGTNSGADWESSQYGNVLDFDGSSDYVRIAEDIEDRDGTFTVSMLLRTGNIAANGDHPIGRGSSGNYQGWSIWQTGSKLAFLAPDVPLTGWLTTSDCTTGTLTDGQWYHIVFVKDGADLACYQDGVLVDSYTMASAAMGDNGWDLLIGAAVAGPAPNSGRHWQGSIASVAIHNRALAATEIAALARDHVADLRLRDTATPSVGIAGSLINGGLVDSPMIGSLVG